MIVPHTTFHSHFPLYEDTGVEAEQGNVACYVTIGDNNDLEDVITITDVQMNAETEWSGAGRGEVVCHEQISSKRPKQKRNRTYPCELCDKTFASSQGLKYHTLPIHSSHVL